MRATLAARPSASTPMHRASPASVSSRQTSVPSQPGGNFLSGTASPGSSGPNGNLRRNSASNTIQAGMAPPLRACSANIACWNSGYGHDSLTKRSPRAFTTRQPGIERSTNTPRCLSSPGTEIVGTPQLWAIRCKAAPAREPAWIASPVLQPTGVAVQSACVGWGRYCSRSAWLRSKPPAASSTPLRARTVTG